MSDVSNAEDGLSAPVMTADPARWAERRALGTLRFIQQWVQAIGTVFPGGPPLIGRWEDPAEIARVLAVISAEGESNHLYRPDGGGTDLVGASLDPGGNGVLLHEGPQDENPLRHLVHPSELTFHAVVANPQYWYFRLEQVDQAPPGPTGYPISEMIPRGPVVIFCKASPYNWRRETYDARHAQMSSEQFQRYIQECAERGEVPAAWEPSAP